MLCLRNAREIFRKFSLYYLYLQITCRKAGGGGGDTVSAEQKKGKNDIQLWRNENPNIWHLTTQNLKRDKANIRIKDKNRSRQWEFWVIEYEFLYI